jgi:hypothetical protein
MDPIVITSNWGWALYDSLLTFDQQGNVIGQAAENHSLSPDGLTWTFNIRMGIKFHNGDPLTAADVVFSLPHFGSKESTNPCPGPPADAGGTESSDLRGRSDCSARRLLNAMIHGLMQVRSNWSPLSRSGCRAAASPGPTSRQ